VRALAEATTSRDATRADAEAEAARGRDSDTERTRAVEEAARTREAVRTAEERAQRAEVACGMRAEDWDEGKGRGVGAEARKPCVTPAIREEVPPEEAAVLARRPSVMRGMACAGRAGRGARALGCAHR